MPQRVNEIDLLRFIAALSVVFYHYAFRGYAADHLSILPYPLLAPIAKYGYLGVELFFMISGFVILMTASNTTLKRFLISRSTRLYPAFWVACTLTFIITLWIGAPRFSASFTGYLGNLTMLSEALGLPPMDGAYWSLFVELRFYLLIVLVLIIKQLKYAQAFLVLWLTVSFLLELKPIGLLRYWLITDYAAFFIAGATCFLIWSESLSLSKGLLLLSAWALSEYEALSMLPSMEAHYKTRFNGLTVLGLISSFFLLLFFIAQRWTGRWARKRWLLLGALTYPLYLIHQNIGYMLFNKLYPSVDVHVLFWGTMILMLLLAYGIHAGFEKKLANNMKRLLESVFKTKQPAHITSSVSSSS